LRADSFNAADPGLARNAEGLTFVRRWNDLSGRSHDAQQPSDGLQPQWIAAGDDGFPRLRFDGANDQLHLSRSIGSNDFCFFAVCRTSQAHEVDPQTSAGVGGLNGQHWLFGATHGGDLDSGAGVSIGTNGVSVYEHGSGYMPALAVAARPLGNGLLLVGVNYAARQPSLDVQGVSVCTGMVSARRSVWAPVEIGSGAYGSFSGDLLEVIGYDRALSAGERRSIAAYLANRYRMTLPRPRHTNFELKSGGEEVVLTHPGGVTADRVVLGVVPRDISYGRSIAEADSWLYYPFPTPGASNSTPGSTEYLFPPTFSHEGGFYTNTFYLSISPINPDAEVRYTLSGSEPTTNSQRYSSPILIRNREGTPDDLAAIPTVPGGLGAAGEVFKGWVVRARVFKPGALPSEIVTRTYWVHPKGRARYSVPVVSLSTDRKNFFDPNLGIYVPGNAPGGNYSQRGPAWERPIHVEMYELDNRVAFSQGGDVKIHGNTSQNFAVKGLDVDGTSGAGRQPFRYRIFPERARTEFEHFLLRPSGHDSHLAVMRDELTQDLAEDTGVESQAARLCVVFLNGEYWGLHYLKEKEDAEFVSFYGNVPLDRIDYLEGYAAAKVGDTQHYDEMIQFIGGNDPAQSTNYARIQTMMEIPNYIDYKAREIFAYRWDIGNHRLWRPHTPEGRWRWLQFDNDVAWGGLGSEPDPWSYDMLAADLSPDGRLFDHHNNETTTFLLRRLMRNESFRFDFLNRFADLLNTTFLPSNILAHIQARAAQLAPEIAEHALRWRAPSSLGDWKAAVAAIQHFGDLRPDYCRQHLMRQFQLPGTIRITINLSASGANAVRLSTLRIAQPGPAGWTGVYFQGVPLPIEANPALGQRFLRWLGPVQTAGPQTQIVSLTNVTVTAEFTTAPAQPPRIENIRILPGSLLEFRCRSDSLQTLGLQSSEDLAVWRDEAWILTGAAGLGTFELSAAPGARQKFFRLVLP